MGVCVRPYSKLGTEGGGGGGDWANTKKKFAHRKNPEKNIVHNKPIEKENRAKFFKGHLKIFLGHLKKNIVQRNFAEKKFLQAIGG